MNKSITLILYLLFVPNLILLGDDSEKEETRPHIYINSISVLAGGGNRNYHDDSFYSIALKYESVTEFTNFLFEVEHLINNETGFGSCFGEPTYYKKTYNTTYLNLLMGFGYRYAGIDLSIAKVNQTRGWCENIMENGVAYFYRLNLGLLDRFFISIGTSSNFRVLLSDEMFEAGITFIFDQGLSKIKLESMRWGYGLLINKTISENFIILGEFYYYDEIATSSSDRLTEIFNIRLGIGYFFSVF